jgi:hypothetical protein
VQSLRKLGDVHDLVAHPQKRRTVARMLHACIGRLLEIQPWLVRTRAGLCETPVHFAPLVLECF